MSGFTPEWLALREPADRRACNRAIALRLREWAKAACLPAGRLAVADLGAGTGSTMRRLAPLLPVPQDWRLADDDPGLLAVARAAAGRCGIPARRLRVRTLCRDLADPATLPVLTAGVRLVTASALFDLVSDAWCRRLLAALARPGRALYAALSYDGRLSLDPADPADSVVRRLFNAHQRSDKGFGRALGPAAAAVLARGAAATGAVVFTARSDWRLSTPDRPLLQALLQGWARAAAEQAPAAAVEIAGWRDRRLQLLEQGRLRAEVGHRDVLATW